MAVNLLNEKDLNTYLESLVFSKQEAVDTRTELSIPELLKNKDRLAYSMVQKWLQFRVRDFFEQYEGCTFLETVKATDTDLPDWAKRNLSEGIPVYRFHPEYIPTALCRTINKLIPFLHQEAMSYLEKRDSFSHAPHKKMPTFRLDYLKMKNKPELQSVEGALLAIERQERQQYLEKIRKEQEASLLSSIETVMTFDNGMQLVLLKTKQSIEQEGKLMDHCVGSGVYYYYNKPDETTKVYSLRDKKGNPHVTIEVRGNALTQCRGRRDSCPTERYTPYIQHIVKKFNWDIQGDIPAVGLIKQEGKYYNLWQLPAGMVIRQDLDFSKLPWSKLPDLSQTVLAGNFLCNRAKIETLQGMPKEVHGNVECCLCPRLKSMEGVSRYVSGFVKIRGCDSLVSTKGCPDFIGGFFDLSHCNNLEDLSVVPSHLGDTILTEGCLKIKNRSLLDSKPVLMFSNTSERN